MRLRLVSIALLAFFASSPIVALGYKVNVDAPSGWAKGIGSVAVVVTQSHPSLNQEDLRKQISDRLVVQSKKLPFSTKLDREVASAGGWDWESKDPADLLAAVFEATKVDAIVEVQAPSADAGKFGRNGAEVRVRVRVVLASGESRLTGDCSAQAFNTASAPENIARHCALRILGDALDENLD